MDNITEKMVELAKYRDKLDDSEKEVFDILVSYASEIIATIEQSNIAMHLERNISLH